jgi:hypothetical protein
MIAALIFVGHFVICLYAFAKYKKEGIGEGLLAVAFVVIIFSVGWTISTMISKVIFPSSLAAQWIVDLQGSRIAKLIAKELTIDTFSLVLLTISEGFFYYFYFRSVSKRKHGTRN